MKEKIIILANIKIRKILILFFLFFYNMILGQFPLSDIVLPNSFEIFEHQNDLYLFGGRGSIISSPTTEFKLIKSEDNGETWSIVVLNDGTLTNKSNFTIFNGVFYNVGGVLSMGGSSRVSYSIDNGISWNHYNAPFPGRSRGELLVHNNKLYMIGGENNGNTSHNDVWSSVDGLNWTLVTNELSTDFPHFFLPQVVSINGKLILTGGTDDEFGVEVNKNGIYISDDDGATWQKNIFPYDVNLRFSRNHFVVNDRLWLTTSIKPYQDVVDGTTLKRREKRLISTLDGINWKVESELDHLFINMPTSNNIIVRSDNSILGIYKKNTGGGDKVYFNISNFEVPTIKSIFKRVTNTAEIITPFVISHNDPSFSGNFSYCIASSNELIVPSSNIEIKNNELKITSTNKVGETKINIEISDGNEIEEVAFWFYNYPEEDVFFSKIKNYRYDLGESTSSIRMDKDFLDNYNVNNNTYSFTSTNSSFINPSEMSVFNFSLFELVDLGGSFSTNVSGESEISISITDGNSSYTDTFWIKVGTDEAPIANGNLADFNFHTNPFNYQLPSNAFTEPEGQEITYSSDNLPCGLHINPLTGEITGTIEFQDNFSINIIATDRYENRAIHQLNILTNSLSLVNNDFEKGGLIYPNPSTNQFYLKSKSRIRLAKIYNLHGKLIEKIEVNSTFFLKKHNLNSGMYLLKIYLEDNSEYVKKIIIN
ncbi:T9SS type A sorting domain-containing protein [Aquimarina rhabdastrellae]